MKIVVCVKEVDGDLSPFDSCAVECGLELSDDVTVVTMGRPSANDVLLRLTRLGAKAILLSDSALAGADTLATSYALSLLVKQLDPDLVICGRQSIDGDTAQTGPALATALGFSLATNVMSFESVDNGIKCDTRLGHEFAAFPALITVERIRQLRFPKIRSKLGEVVKMSATDIGADISKCGLKGSPTRVRKTFESTVGRRKCKFIQMSELRDVIAEARLKTKNESAAAECADKLKDEVWCIGEDVAEIARSIAENVIVIDRKEPAEIAALAKAKQPRFILWPADLWGRKNAPVVQAMLGTGLCADCTALETDGNDLFMYRPAFGGTLTAKIKCLTTPVMATVRTTDENACDLLVGCGKGVRDCLDEVHAFADELGGEYAASRGLVDCGLAPYSQQVGLTGKTICCSVYVAVGISGAVHHTCALDRVGTVIAINPDKDARIFEYADYGIVSEFDPSELAH